MKRLSLLLMIAAAALAVSCDDEKSFDPDLLVGKWARGTEYYRYDADHNGATWDTADDVQESEAQPFTWELEGDQLTLIHRMEMGGVVPKVYTVTDLTASTLTYRDNYQQTYTYSKTQ